MSSPTAPIRVQCSNGIITVGSMLQAQSDLVKRQLEQSSDGLIDCSNHDGDVVRRASDWAEGKDIFTGFSKTAPLIEFALFARVDGLTRVCFDHLRTLVRHNSNDVHDLCAPGEVLTDLLSVGKPVRDRMLEDLDFFEIFRVSFWQRDKASGQVGQSEDHVAGLYLKHIQRLVPDAAPAEADNLGSVRDIYDMALRARRGFASDRWRPIIGSYIANKLVKKICFSPNYKALLLLTTPDEPYRGWEIKQQLSIWDLTSQEPKMTFKEPDVRDAAFALKNLFLKRRDLTVSMHDELTGKGAFFFDVPASNEIILSKRYFGVSNSSREATFWRYESRSSKRKIPGRTIALCAGDVVFYADVPAGAGSKASRELYKTRLGSVDVEQIGPAFRPYIGDVTFVQYHEALELLVVVFQGLLSVSQGGHVIREEAFDRNHTVWTPALLPENVHSEIFSESPGASCAALSPDGRNLCIIAGSNCYIWDCANQFRRRTVVNKAGLCSLAWSPDSKFLAVGGIKSFQIFNMEAETFLI